MTLGHEGKNLPQGVQDMLAGKLLSRVIFQNPDGIVQVETRGPKGGHLMLGVDHVLPTHTVKPNITVQAIQLGAVIADSRGWTLIWILPNSHMHTIPGEQQRKPTFRLRRRLGVRRDGSGRPSGRRHAL
jgi:hypothetical protein